MTTSKRIVATVAGILLAASIVCAQEQNAASRGRSTITVTAAATADRVRFAAPSSVVQMRLEIYNANGEKVFDNEIRGGNVIDWHLQDGQAQPLSDGSYLCVITGKSLSGRISQKLGRVSLTNSAAILNPADTFQLTSRQSQAVGPLEENASFTIFKEGESQTATVIAHDATDGQITRGRGALSFRIGDFFSGKDSEQMRLTEDGNLGIGTSDPKLKLDVAGMIGARDGFMFSDGSTLSLNRKGALTHTTSDGQVVPGASGTGTQNQLARWTDNSGTLGNSAMADVNGAIGIGTTSPQSGLDYRNGSAAFFTRDFPTNPGNAVSALQLGLSNVGSRNAGVGPSFLFFSENSAGAKSFVGRVSGVWENPAAGAEAGAIFFQVRANSADVNALTERMRITASGNVGIGTTAPAAKLDVRGDISTSTQYNIDGNHVLSAERTNLFAGVDAGGANRSGDRNSFFGSSAGSSNTTGDSNAFFGSTAGQFNTTTRANSFFGANAGRNNDANDNAFFGTSAGLNNTTGAGNTFVGRSAGLSNTTESNNTFIGFNSNGTAGIHNATAIGAGAVANVNNEMVLGTPANFVFVPGELVVGGALSVHSTVTLDSTVTVVEAVTLRTLGSAGDTSLCRNFSNEISTCSSSLRYKTAVQSFSSGLDIVRRLRPIAFNWKEGGMRDVGFAAEEVNEIEPLLTTRNNKGEIEGVKYNQLSAVFVNAFKEQQAQIRQQQEQIKRQQEQAKRQQEELGALRRIVCRSHPLARACKN